VTLPAGSSTGTKLRIKGQGVTSGGKTGDLFAEIEVQLPKKWSPHDQDLIKKLDEGPAPAARKRIQF